LAYNTLEDFFRTRCSCRGSGL